MIPPSSTTAAGVPAAPPRRKVFLTVLTVFLLGCGIAAATTAWWVKHNFYASAIRPVTLSSAEQQALDAKLQVLQTPAATPRQPTPEERHRTLTISQKEINAYLANQNLGDKVRVELGHDRVTATVIVPFPQDAGLPLISGTTLRVTLALDAAMAADKKFTVKLSDVRVGGISVPNAWLGDIKGVNLVAENVERDPALQQFLTGIQEMEIRPEGLRVLLNE
ncbi:MAG TPA: hypothetical protein VD994_10960 [Prosthecobacter sp.]|nr:hypothetical protein [Prosthecobacter sp.]